eukprot:15449157-Alexandrium_andersonii.AAC.1
MVPDLPDTHAVAGVPARDVDAIADGSVESPDKPHQSVAGYGLVVQGSEEFEHLCKREDGPIHP